MMVGLWPLLLFSGKEFEWDNPSHTRHRSTSYDQKVWK